MSKSILNSVANFTIGSAIPVSFITYDDNYTHNLVIKLGSTTIKTITGITTPTNANFSTGEVNTIYSLLSNSSSGVFTFTLTTKDGNTTVGTSSTTATGTIPTSAVPVITDVYFSEAVDGLATKFGFYVKTKSKIAVNIIASPSNGSRLTSYKTTIDNDIYNSNQFTSDFVQTSGQNTVPIEVKDARGLTATSDRYFSVVDYEIPTIASINAQRCNSNGTLNDSGTYAIVKGYATIKSLSNKNDKSFMLQYKKSNVTSWTTHETYTSGYTYNIQDGVIISGISADDTYDFRIVASDYFYNGDEAITRGTTLESGFTILDLLANGKGIAFGGVCTQEGFTNFMESYDKYDTLIQNGKAILSEDCNTTLYELVFSSINSPDDTKSWFVRTMFGTGKNTSSLRIQVAYPYLANGSNPTYVRYFNGTSWSNWSASDLKAFYFGEGNGYIHFANGLLFQWGRTTITPASVNTVTSVAVYFPLSYTYGPNVTAIPNSNVPHVLTFSVGGGTVAGANLYSMVIYMTRTNLTATTFQWQSIGYKA